MATQAFVNSLIKEIIQPGVDELVELPYFTELRTGKLSTKRLQGWALQHYLHNHALLKGFALCMVKNSHDPELFKYFLYQMNEEQHHPDLAEKFGLEIGLQEADFLHRDADLRVPGVHQQDHPRHAARLGAGEPRLGSRQRDHGVPLLGGTYRRPERNTTA